MADETNAAEESPPATPAPAGHATELSLTKPKTWIEKLDEFLAQKNFVTEGFDRVEEKINIKKRYQALAILLFIALYLVIGYGAPLLCNTIGFIYPAYISIKAIESPEKDDDTMWLMYWVVFAAFSVVEFFSDIFLSWFPFYFLAKCGFLVWCMAPVTWNGSSFIYMKFLRPLVLRNQGELDRALERAQKGAQNMAKGAMKEARQAAASVAAEVVTGSLKKDD